MVAQVHERAAHGLIIHRLLRVPKPPDTGVDVVDDQATHVPLTLDDFTRAFVSLSNQSSRFARVFVFEFSRARDDWRHPHGFTRELEIERFPTPFSTPHAQNQRHVRRLDDVSARVSHLSTRAKQ